MTINSDKIGGKAKQTIGKATGDDSLRNKGRAQEAKGDAKEKTQKAGRKVSDKVDNALDKK